MRVLGVVMAYNEEDCVGNAVRSLAAGGVEVHVFDHGSNDGTREQIAKVPGALRHEILRESIPAVEKDGSQSSMLWNHIGWWVHQWSDVYDWVVWQASDEIIRQPNGELMTVAALEAEAYRGTEVIRPLMRHFWPTPRDPQEEDNYLRRIRHYRYGRNGHSPRAWRIDLTPEEIPLGLHIQDPATGPKFHPWYGYWPEGTRVSNNEWLLDHYPVRSEEQARKKVRDRAWKNPAGKQPYHTLRRKLAAGDPNALYERRAPEFEARELVMP